MKILEIQRKNLPERLTNLYDPPAQLWLTGVSLQQILEKPCLAVVGSRAVTPYGASVTQQLVHAAAKAGVVIVSGLALGIDSIAHRAALEANGTTIAVLPAGLQKIYPASHQGLSEHIIARGGILLTEYDGDEPPRKYQFIARNRLIAGLADAVLITEAAEKSGSLHTAQFALDLGKDVLVVPGPINSSNSKGVNNLLKVGAIPVTSSQDILEYFNLTNSQANEKLGNNREEQCILRLLQQGVTTGAELLDKSQLSVTTFHQTMTMLEINNVIGSLGGDHWFIKT